MPIQAADFDTVFEALLDRTAYLKAHTTYVKETIYASPGDYVHTWLNPGFVLGQGRLVEITAIGGGGGGGGGPTAGTASGAGGGSSGNWRQFWLEAGAIVTATSAVHIGAGGAGGVGPTAAGQDGEASTLRLAGSPIYIGSNYLYTFPGGLGGGAATAGSPGLGAQATADGLRNGGYAAGASGATAGATAGATPAGENGFNVPGPAAGAIGSQGGLGSGAGGGGAQGSSFCPGGPGGGGVRRRGTGGGPDSAGNGFTQGVGGDGAPGMIVIREYFLDFAT